jgi:hypothetical protein
MSFGMFIFGDTLEKAIEAIPEDHQLKYYRYIKDYGLHGIEPDLSGFELATWVQMKTLIDNTMPKRNNNRTGKNGAPFGNKNESKNKEQPENNPNNLNNPNQLETTPNNLNNLNNPNQPSQCIMYNVNENVNVNINDKENAGFSFSESQNLPEPEPAHPPDKELPPGKPVANSEDAVTVWNKAREYWNLRELKPECRDLMMKAADTPEILRTFQHYSWDEIKNAIGNFAWHKFKAGPEYRPPPPYGSLAGFLKAGVEKYFDDGALDQQFLEEKR